jgi:hypothetical protein
VIFSEPVYDQSSVQCFCFTAPLILVCCCFSYNYSSKTFTDCWHDLCAMQTLFIKMNFHHSFRFAAPWRRTAPISRNTQIIYVYRRKKNSVSHSQHEKDGLASRLLGVMKKRGSSCVILLKFHLRLRALHHIPKFIAACAAVVISVRYAPDCLRDQVGEEATPRQVENHTL